MGGAGLDAYCHSRRAVVVCSLSFTTNGFYYIFPMLPKVPLQTFSLWTESHKRCVIMSSVFAHRLLKAEPSS